MSSGLKRALFGLLGKDPEAVVVSFASGDADRARRMVAEIRALEPGRRHFVVTLRPLGIEDVREIVVAGEAAYLEARRALRPYRIGLAPVLFDGGSHVLRGVALALAPTKMLAYNARLERHHLHWRSPIASLLFWRGTGLDRIWLRPWFWPWGTDRTVVPMDVRTLAGRKESAVRGQVSVLTPYLPYPLSHGGAVRLYYLLRNSSVEFDIHLFAFVETEPEEQDLEKIKEFCASITLVAKPRYREPRWSTLKPPEVLEYRSAAMDRVLAERKARLLQVEYTQLASYGGDILVEHDLTFDLYRQVYERKRTAASWWDYKRWLWFERGALKRFGRVVVMSEKDAVMSGHPQATVIANGVDLARFQPSAEPAGQRLLFIGSFRHFPNVVAFRFFLDEVWPLLADRYPELRVTVVAGPDAALYWGDRELPRIERFDIRGYVADVKPLYDEANVVIVPTLESAGTNVKVLEAMAMRRAVVSTATGCAGLGLRHGESVWVADTADDFAKGIARLIEDVGLRERLAAAARRIAEERYAWEEIARAQCRLWGSLTDVPLTIRGARAEDYGALERIQREAPEASQWAVEEYARYDMLVAEYRGVAIGFLATRQTAPDEFEILNMAVAKERRGQGVAGRLMGVAQERMKGDIYLEVRESNRVARRFYEGLGFIELDRRKGYYPALDGSDPYEVGIVMRYRKC
ncbi:MAG: GNAT family N-acetyltransferase [Bryobacterales bacterium]|nr:GNAT family N-acetyltransferase [Bryobacterales bacterium]